MLALLMLLLQTSAHTTSPPPLPYYARHVKCWCEKCDQQDQAGHWTAARELPAYGKQGVPSTRLFDVSRGEEVTVLDGVVVVDRAERVRVVKPMELVGENAPLSIGDVFWVVQIDGEGAATIWHNGRLFEATLVGDVCAQRRPSCDAVTEQSARRQWWIKVRNARGQVGWVRADWNFVDASCGVHPRL